MIDKDHRIVAEGFSHKGTYLFRVSVAVAVALGDCLL